MKILLIAVATTLLSTSCSTEFEAKVSQIRFADEATQECQDEVLTKLATLARAEDRCPEGVDWLQQLQMEHRSAEGALPRHWIIRAGSTDACTFLLRVELNQETYRCEVGEDPSS